MHNQTGWGWCLKGIEGGVNIVDMLIKDEVPISPHFLAELEKQTERMMAAVERARANVEGE